MHRDGVKPLQPPLTFECWAQPPATPAAAEQRGRCPGIYTKLGTHSPHTQKQSAHLEPEGGVTVCLQRSRLSGETRTSQTDSVSE